MLSLSQIFFHLHKQPSGAEDFIPTLQVRKLRPKERKRPVTKGAGAWHEKGSVLSPLAPGIRPTHKLRDLAESLLGLNDQGLPPVTFCCGLL